MEDKLKAILEKYGEEVINTVETPGITRIMVTARLLKARNEASKEIIQLCEEAKNA